MTLDFEMSRSLDLELSTQKRSERKPRHSLPSMPSAPPIIDDKTRPDSQEAAQGQNKTKMKSREKKSPSRAPDMSQPSAQKEKSARRKLVLSPSSTDSSPPSIQQEKRAKSGSAETTAGIIEEDLKSFKSEQEESAEEEGEFDNSNNLFECLYECSKGEDIVGSLVDDYDVYSAMFNPEINIDDILSQFPEVLKPFYDDYLSMVEDMVTHIGSNQFVHMTSLGSKNSTCRRAVARRINLFSPSATALIEDCTYHSGQCRLVEKNVAFLCYLSGLATESQEDKVLEDEIILGRLAVEAQENATEIEYEAEKLIAATQNKRQIRNASVKELQMVDDEAIMDSDIPISAMPNFTILEKDYVLLHDIQVLFKLREDYCLALIAQQMEEEQDWVDQDPTLEQLNTCFEAKDALEACFTDALEYKDHVPSEIDFLDTQRLLGGVCTQQFLIEEQLKVDTVVGPIIEEPDDATSTTKADSNEKSINIWKEGLVEEDEKNQLCVEIDAFLGRRGGLRKKRGSLGKDSSLMNYIKAFPRSGMYIIHRKYSNNAYEKILVFKTLSKYLGAYQVPPGVNRIILIEKNMALDIFGHAPGHPSCRAGYFLCYTAYALALGIEDPKLLTDYGKSYMLSHREREPHDDEKLLTYEPTANI